MLRSAAIFDLDRQFENECYDLIDTEADRITVYQFIEAMHDANELGFTIAAAEVKSRLLKWKRWKETLRCKGK